MGLFDAVHAQDPFCSSYRNCSEQAYEFAPSHRLHQIRSDIDHHLRGLS